jgi:hypothetical protein
MTVEKPTLYFLSGMGGVFVPITGFQTGCKHPGIPILKMFAQRSGDGMSIRFGAGACRLMCPAHILIILSRFWCKPSKRSALSIVTSRANSPRQVRLALKLYS